MPYLSLSQLNSYAQLNDWVDELIVSIIDCFKGVNYTYTTEDNNERILFQMLEVENYSIDEQFIDINRKQFIVTINLYFDCCGSQTFVIPFYALESEEGKNRFVRMTIDEWKKEYKPKYDEYVERENRLKKERDEKEYKKFLELSEKYGKK
ncbi:MAG: hypothetical protein K2M17_03700 [Bacilli bacterium]|nr:hypothetical protein [Bacilli bacterium]